MTDSRTYVSSASEKVPSALSIANIRGALGTARPAFTLVCCLVLLASRAWCADSLYSNGTILSMDAQGRTFEAVGVRDGRIVAVGTKAAVSQSLRPGFAQIDLHGRTLLPGFYAAHDHFPEAGEEELYQVDLNSPPLGAIRNMGQLVAALKRKADATPAGEWVVGWGYDDTLLAETRHPTRDDLDRASTHHPIWIATRSRCHPCKSATCRWWKQLSTARKCSHANLRPAHAPLSNQ